MKILNKRGTAIGCLCALTLTGVLFGCSNFRQDPIDSNSVDNNEQIGEIQKHMTEVEYERYMKGRETLQEEKNLLRKPEKKDLFWISKTMAPGLILKIYFGENAARLSRLSFIMIRRIFRFYPSTASA